MYLSLWENLISITVLARYGRRIRSSLFHVGLSKVCPQRALAYRITEALRNQMRAKSEITPSRITPRKRLQYSNRGFFADLFGEMCLVTGLYPGILLYHSSDVININTRS